MIKKPAFKWKRPHAAAMPKAPANTLGYEDWMKGREVGWTEAQHQVRLFNWASTVPAHIHEYNLRAFMTASANGGSRNAREAKNLKAQGVSPGFPDIEVAIAKQGFGGLYIELKRPKAKGRTAGTPTVEQLEWITKLELGGQTAVVCYGWREAADAICQYVHNLTFEEMQEKLEKQQLYKIRK